MSTGCGLVTKPEALQRAPAPTSSAVAGYFFFAVLLYFSKLASLSK